jgi:Cu+-exporting ATPase
MTKIVLKIGGMSCSACSNGLEKYLNKQDGIGNASVNLVMANALIEYDENKVNRKMLDKFVKEAGFESLGIYDENEEEKPQSKRKLMFIIFAALSVFLMYVSMGHMIGLPQIPFLNMTVNPVNYSIALLILTLPFLFYGFDIIKSGIKNAIHLMPNMDTLVAIGVLSSFLYSLYGTIMVILGNESYMHSLYYESSAIVIFFIKLGRYIDSVSKDKTKDAIKSLVQITPKDAVIKIDGVEKKVTIDEIKKGDTVISKPGERISVDGTVISGKTHIDESFITGESKPVLKEAGSKVIAGSNNYDGYIEYRAERIGKESTISEIVRIVIEATSTKAPLAGIADKISGYFVPSIIVIAILSFIGYLIADRQFNEAINTFVTVLVVACPCSLGLATPLAIVVSEGKCAKNGILIKKSEVLENASKIQKVVFDKTGTLTYGNLRVSSVNNHSSMSDDEIMSLVSGIESKSSHPIAKAFSDYINSKNIKSSSAYDFVNLDGRGISAFVETKKYYVGNSKLLDEAGINNPYKSDELRLSQNGNSIVYVADEKEVLAVIGVNDKIRDNAKSVISELKSLGAEPIMLTGDNEKTAKKIADELGIEKIIAGVLPAEKGNAIKDLQKDGKRIMMIGDGINDSPALTLSDIGVGINSGSDIAMDSSDVILMNNDLTKVVDLINTGSRTVRNIKQNLFWAFFYNCLMIPIAIGLLSPLGITINPMIASIAMTLSSLTVILNALRLKR